MVVKNTNLKILLFIFPAQPVNLLLYDFHFVLELLAIIQYFLEKDKPYYEGYHVNPEYASNKQAYYA